MRESRARHVTGRSNNPLRGAGTATTDARGHFALPLRASREYVFTLTALAGWTRLRTRALRVEVKPDMPSLRLIILDDRPPDSSPGNVMSHITPGRGIPGGGVTPRSNTPSANCT